MLDCPALAEANIRTNVTVPFTTKTSVLVFALYIIWLIKYINFLDYHFCSANTFLNNGFLIYCNDRNCGSWRVQ